MTYEEAVAIAREISGTPFTGILLSVERNYLGTYTVLGDEEEPGWVGVYFEGSHLFSHEAEEEQYALEDAPKEVESLHFRDLKGLSNEISGCTADHVLYKLFQTLPDPETLWTAEEKRGFLTLAKELIDTVWCKEN